jgi:uncharacterized protein YjbI with pentapeptide repeats
MDHPPIPQNKAEWIALLQTGDVEAFNTARQETHYQLLDLSQGDFHGLNLSGINLSFTELSFANFAGCVLHDAKLILARGHELNFRQADCYMAMMTEVQFTEVDLGEANLGAVDFEDAWFKDCSFNEAQFADATLRRTRFNGCNLNEADLRDVHYESAEFKACEMAWAYLPEEIKASLPPEVLKIDD